MSFLLQRLAELRISLTEVKGQVLRIGRGTNAHVRSENAAVALEHAVIEETGGGWEIVDRGSITGSYVNGRPIERARLARGDAVEIGDLRLVVQAAEPGKPLFLRIDQRELDEVPRKAEVGEETHRTRAAKGAGTIKAKATDFARVFDIRRSPLSKAAMSILLLVLTAGATLLVGLSSKSAFEPGDVSVAHASARLQDGRRVIRDNDCNACHTPFGGASDKKCNECHGQTFHQAQLAVNGSCTACHSEHRQMANLAEVQQSFCIECHSDIRKIDANADIAPKITAFEKDHPEFVLATVRDGRSVRLAVNDPAITQSDPNPLRFNHRCHLSGDCGFRPATRENPRRERETLDCAACHEIDVKSGAALPVRYEKACARCHVLTFDNRFPPVPHGIDLPTLAGVIANAYGGNTQLLTRSASDVARIFATRSAPSVNVGSETVRNAQKVVKVRCVQCHQLEPNGERVIKPAGARSWFKGVRGFSHTDHLARTLELRCVDCHDHAAESASTRDLSLPTISDCVRCHRQSPTHPEQALGRCLACHYYHDLTSKHGPGWTARASTLSIPVAALPVTRFVESSTSTSFTLAPNLLRTLVIGGMAIVGLVVLILLVGVLMRMMRRRREAASAMPLPKAAPPSAPPPPPPPMPAAPSGPAPQGPATAEPTMMAGTEAIQFYGTLYGVSGPLKGKRIPITEVGFYIGRDKQSAEIVIDAPSISRRHAWVGVKDGKVMAIDQRSTNGSFINDRSSPRITEVELKPGEVLILGENAAGFRYDR